MFAAWFGRWCLINDRRNCNWNQTHCSNHLSKVIASHEDDNSMFRHVIFSSSGDCRIFSFHIFFRWIRFVDQMWIIKRTRRSVNFCGDAHFESKFDASRIKMFSFCSCSFEIVGHKNCAVKLQLRSMWCFLTVFYFDSVSTQIEIRQ